MKAAQINNYGETGIVQINEIDTPKVDSGKVLVKINSAGINPVDYKIVRGYMKDMMPVKFPYTLGGDFSGVIEEVGEGVTEYKKGDEAFGQSMSLAGGTGSFAEFSIPNAISKKPSNLNMMEAGALPLVGVCAYLALVENMKLQKDQKVLILGGAGGIGMIAIQMAKYIGAFVATTVSSKDKEFVKSLGADVVIDYKEEKFEDLVKDYDAVFDNVGGDTYTSSFKVLKKGGIIVSMLAQPNEELTKQYEVKSISLFAQINSDLLVKVSDMVEKANIKIHIDKTFPLSDAESALSYLEKGHPQGKVVINIS